MYALIDAFINKCVHLTDEELAYFHSLLQPVTYKKKTLLLHAGEVCNFEAFINKGCARLYYIDDNGFDVIIQFAIEGWWISDLASFTQQKPSELFIEAVEDTEVLLIKYADKEALFNSVPKFERMFRLMVQRNHETIMNRLIANLSASAEDRYDAFIKKYPEIVQRVPQYLIASYLGISAEFLSKIRTRKLRKH